MRTLMKLLRFLAPCALLLLAACADLGVGPATFSLEKKELITGKFSIGPVSIAGHDLAAEEQHPSAGEREFADELRHSVETELAKANLLSAPEDNESDQLRFKVCYWHGGPVVGYTCSPIPTAAILPSLKDYRAATTIWHGEDLVATSQPAFGMLPVLSDKQALADEYAALLVRGIEQNLLGHGKVATAPP